MTGLLTRLGTALDTRGGETRMVHVRRGWPGSTHPDIRFHRSPLVQYRWREAGSGPTILFTADPPMTIEVYEDLFERFAAHFRVVVVELPAMGFSVAAPGYGFGFRETNDDLADFIRVVCGPDTIFAFSCVASLAAIDIAHRMPELASHLCLIQSGGVAAFARWKAGRDPKNILGRPIVGQLAMRRMAAARMPQWYALSVGRRDRIDHFCSCARTSFDHGAMWSLASAYQCYMDIADELPRPRQPILSIWGPDDRSHPEGNAHTLAKLYPDVAMVTLDGLGHTPELEDPDAVLGAIRSFVGSRG